MTSAAPPPGSRHLAVAWSERGWPRFAGALVAVGVVGDVGRWGWLGLAAVSTGGFAFLSLMVYGTMSDYGYSIARSLRAALVGTVVAVVALGLMEVSAALGGLAIGVAALTCPLVADRAAAAWGRRARKRRLDRAFARIVADLERDPSWRQAA